MRLDSKHFITSAAPVLAIILLAFTAWQVLGVWQKESAGGDFVTALSTGAAAVQRQVPQTPLSSFELFGSSQINAPDVQQNTDNLPETNLQLTLRGVLAANGDFAGSALIEDERSNTDAYLVGDTLPGNATLRSVHPTRVIIERSGKLENLYFPEIDSRNGLSAVAAEVPNPEPPYTPPAPSNSAVSQPTGPQPSGASSSPTDEQRRAEIRERLEQLRQSLRNGS
jgi:general secretion pathway protein C